MIVSAQGIHGSGKLFDFLVIDVLACDLRLFFSLLTIAMDIARPLVVAKLLGSSAHFKEEGTDFIKDVCGNTEDEQNFNHGAIF